MAENENMELENVESQAVNNEPPVDDTKDKEIAKLKALLSKANSEAASYKKQMREKMSEEEKSKADAEAEREEMMKKLAAFERDAKISNFTSALMTSGIDGDLSKTMANALVDGDMDTVFANLKAHTESIKKSAVASAMANQSGITTGTPGVPEVTQAQFDAMSLSERVNLYNTDKSLYDKLNGGK